VNDEAFASARETMIERQLRRRGIAEPHILDAFRAVPREAFVGAEHAAEAYGDHPLPIGAGQTISQPYIVALMIQAAGVAPGDLVLEVGAGSGYAAAVIGCIAAQVVAMERHPELAEEARERLARLGFSNVHIVVGDGTRGWPDSAPYDAILAAASGSHVPDSLVDQLKPGGCLVMPIGDQCSAQQLVKVTRGADGSLRRLDLGAVRFVPLIGEEGWSDAGHGP
jgi:protein-L-isoaspartate(D-aspartate) O-methyltransferase